MNQGSRVISAAQTFMGAIDSDKPDEEKMEDSMFEGGNAIASMFLMMFNVKKFV